jgi:mono/diheme cytochrome c family protein
LLDFLSRETLKIMPKRYAIAMLALLSLSGCAMNEEVKRINETQRAQKSRDASRSTNLTGEQLFIRTCNTCHPGGKEGMGPSLQNVDKDLPDDNAVKKLIRQGRGIMPGQPKDVINDAELDLLVQYVRKFGQETN